MTRPLRKSFCFMAAATVLAGCSTQPTITVPNPLAAFNGVLTAPRVASAPTYSTVPAGSIPSSGYYQPAPANYATLTPNYTTALPTTTYGASIPAYGSVNPGYTASAPIIDTGSYSFGTETAVQTINTQDLATPAVVQAPAPAYTLSAPAVAESSYVLGGSGASVPATPVTSAAIPTLGAVQPVQATGTTYDLTTPSVTTTLDPVAGLTVNSNYETFPAPVQIEDTGPSMGGSFQVTPQFQPSLGGGIATYNAAPATLGVPSATY